MPRASTTRRAKAYRCAIGFAHPADAAIRQRLRDGDHMPHEERGEMVRHAVGDEMAERDLPPEVFAACIRRGAIEPIGAPQEPGEEASDDAQE